MNPQALMTKMAAITEARKATGLTVTYKTADDTEWQTASFATTERAEYFKARVAHQGGVIQ